MQCGRDVPRVFHQNNANNMTSPIAEIRAFVAENRTSDALARLLELSQSNKQIHDSILMVLAEFNDLNAQRLRGTVSSE
jgi:hypothetical protein